MISYENVFAIPDILSYRKPFDTINEVSNHFFKTDSLSKCKKGLNLKQKLTIYTLEIFVFLEKCKENEINDKDRRIVDIL